MLLTVLFIEKLNVLFIYTPERYLQREIIAIIRKLKKFCIETKVGIGKHRKCLAFTHVCTKLVIHVTVTIIRLK